MSAGEREIVPYPDEEGRKSNVIAQRSRSFRESHVVRRVGLEAYVLTESERHPGFRRFTLMNDDDFEVLAYNDEVIGAVAPSAMKAVYKYVIRTAPDLSRTRHLMLLGDWIWDSRKLEYRDDVDHSLVLWRSPYTPVDGGGPVKFLMDAAGGDPELYEDMLQGVAPILMDRKPMGAIWLKGSGANGKSSFMEAMYRLFPDQLASVSVKRLEDERDAPALNSKLANVVKESSERYVEDTANYKAATAHEDFSVHKFHSQGGVTVRGNVHHVFATNHIPTFSDKGKSMQDRNHVIPFSQQFDRDPTFEDRTFTPEILGHLLSEMLRVAEKLAENSFRYSFGEKTRLCKIGYDSGAQNVTAFVDYLKDEGFAAFTSFGPVHAMYENWCAINGFAEIGGKHKVAAIVKEEGFFEYKRRVNGVSTKVWMTDAYEMGDLTEAAMPNNKMFRLKDWLPKAAKETYSEKEPEEEGGEKKPNQW